MKILKAIASYAEKSWEQPFQCKYVFHPSLDGASIGVFYDGKELRETLLHNGKELCGAIRC